MLIVCLPLLPTAFFVNSNLSCRQLVQKTCWGSFWLCNSDTFYSRNNSCSCRVLALWLGSCGDRQLVAACHVLCASPVVPYWSVHFHVVVLCGEKSMLVSSIASSKIPQCGFWPFSVKCILKLLVLLVFVFNLLITIMDKDEKYLAQCFKESYWLYPSVQKIWAGYSCLGQSFLSCNKAKLLQTAGVTIEATGSACDQSHKLQVGGHSFLQKCVYLLSSFPPC